MTQGYEDKFGPTPEKPTTFDSATFEIVVNAMKTKTVNGTPDVVYYVDFDYFCTVDGQSTSQQYEIFYDDETLEAQTSFQDFQSLTAIEVEGWILDKIPFTHLQYSLASRFSPVDETTVSPPWAA